MKQWTNHPLPFLVVGIAIAALFWVFIGHLSSDKEPLQEAYQAYSAGEQAQTVADRKMQFNKALELYSQVEADHQTDGRLYYNLGNTYFQLGEYPLSIYNYYRAQTLRPSDDKIQQNLQIALDKAGVKEPKTDSIFKQIFYPHFYLSLSERLRLFFFSGLGFLAFISAYMWYKQGWLWNFIILSGLICAFFFISTLYTRYMTPLEGVMVQSALLYRDAGTQYAHVREEPVIGGSKVEVIDILKNGEWLKVMTPEGTLGYVPQKSIKLL